MSPRVFGQFPDTPFPLPNGPFRIKWNYLLLSHQRKVVDTAQDSRKVRKECENVNPTDLFRLVKKNVNDVMAEQRETIIDGGGFFFSFLLLLYQSSVITGY